jgi:hypothetical protein
MRPRFPGAYPFSCAPSRFRDREASGLTPRQMRSVAMAAIEAGTDASSANPMTTAGGRSDILPDGPRRHPVLVAVSTAKTAESAVFATFPPPALLHSYWGWR